MKKLLGTICFLLLLPLMLHAQNPYASYNVRLGYEAWQQGDYQAAYDALSKEVTQVNPENGMAYALLAFVCRDAGEPAQMLRCANRAVKYLPKNDLILLPDVLLLLHKFYWQADDTIKAEEYLTKALKLNNKNDKVYQRYEAFYKSCKRYDDMIALGKQAVKVLPKELEGYTMQFEGYMGKEDYKLAMVAAGDIVRVAAKQDNADKLRPYAMEYKMRVLLKQKRYEDALSEALPLVDAINTNKVLNAVIEVADSTDWQVVIDSLNACEPRYERQPWWAILRGEIYMNHYRYPEAYIELYKAMQIQEMSNGWRQMGFLASNRMDDQKRAIACYEHAILLDSTSAVNYIVLADVYYESKKYDKAEAILEKAIQLEPLNENSYIMRARCYQETGRYDEAIEDYYNAMVAEPDDANFYFSIARVYDMKGDSIARQQAIDNGLKMYSVRKDSLGMNEYRGIGDLDKACEVALAKLKPTSTDNYIYNTACVLALAGRTDEALDYLEQSMEKGFLNITHIKHDEDFESLRDNPRFKELIVTYTAKTKEMQQYINDQLAK